MGKKESSAQVSIKLARLFFDYLQFVRWQKIFGSSCLNKSNLESNCCAAHSQLDLELRKLERAVVNVASASHAKPLSLEWWRDNGFILPENFEVMD